MDSEEENLERRLNSIFTIILLFLVSQLILERFLEMLLVYGQWRKKAQGNYGHDPRCGLNFSIV